MRSHSALLASTACLTLLVSGRPAVAQRLTTNKTAFAWTATLATERSRVDSARSHRTPPSTPKMVVGGVFMAVTGAIAGGFSGAGLSQGCDGFMCEAAGAVFGGMIGEAIGVPLGVRLGGGRVGLGQQMMTSFSHPDGRTGGCSRDLRHVGVGGYPCAAVRDDPGGAERRARGHDEVIQKQRQVRDSHVTSAAKCRVTKVTATRFDVDHLAGHKSM